MSASAPSIPLSQIDPGALVLDVVNKQLKTTKRVNVDRRVTDGSMDRSMAQASTLTLQLEDAERELLRSGLFEKTIDIEIDGVWWRLVQVQKTGDSLQLTFEDRVVSLLRAIRSPRKAARKHMTRAEFALSIVREIKVGPAVPFFCPELDVRQPIASASQQMSSSSRRQGSKGGINRKAKLTVKGTPATSQQITNGQRVLDVADSLKASQTAQVALIEACIVESSMQNLNHGDLDSLGILQVRSSTAHGMRIDNRNVEQCANAFLTRGFWGKGGAISLAAKNPTKSAGWVAQQVQGSAYPSRYDQVEAEAAKWVANYTGGASTTPTKTPPFQFQRGGTAGQKEDSWSCLQRLASEVQWRCFVSQGGVYFVSDATLLAQRIEAIVSEQEVGVENIDFQIDSGKAKSDATITARTTRYDFFPGMVVELDHCGPANGRWLVSDMQRSLFDSEATITLTRPMQPLLEPAAGSTGTTKPPSGGPNVGTSGDAQVQRALVYAQQMHGHRWPYVWGGGHAHCGRADNPRLIDPSTGRTDPGNGFDCSGAVCAVLASAGLGLTLGKSAPGSGTLESWGAAGKGRGLTVYANSVHTFIVFHTSSGDHHFGTGDWGKGWNGPGFNPYLHPTSGFVARHWPGT